MDCAMITGLDSRRNAKFGNCVDLTATTSAERALLDYRFMANSGPHVTRRLRCGGHPLIVVTM